MYSHYRIDARSKYHILDFLLLGKWIRLHVVTGTSTITVDTEEDWASFWAPSRRSTQKPWHIVRNSCFTVII